jgi:hypothetical protein
MAKNCPVPVTVCAEAVRTQVEHAVINTRPQIADEVHCRLFRPLGDVEVEDQLGRLVQAKPAVLIAVDGVVLGRVPLFAVNESPNLVNLNV